MLRKELKAAQTSSANFESQVDLQIILIDVLEKQVASRDRRLAFQAH